MLCNIHGAIESSISYTMLSAQLSSESKNFCLNVLLLLTPTYMRLLSKASQCGCVIMLYVIHKLWRLCNRRTTKI